jgi:outer membrane lipoprotein SlyB
MRAAVILLLPLALFGCGPRFSPDAYATRAVQQMNRVEQGVVIGRRPVTVQAEGSVGAATGGAAGGIIGSQLPGSDVARAVGGVGGALVGGLFGVAAERVTGDTTAFEYIVRKTNGDLVSVTQSDPAPLEVGLRVLVIAGAQARIVPDYTTPVATGATPAPAAPAAAPAVAPEARPGAPPDAAPDAGQDAASPAPAPDMPAVR